MDFESSFNIKLIYVFRINDNSHEGCLKVGEASINDKITDLSVFQPNNNVLNRAAKNRINQYTTTAGIQYELLYTETTVFFEDDKIKAFNDGAVHEILHRSGIKNKYFDTDKKANEWFLTDLETIKNAIKAAKEGRKSLNTVELSVGNNPIVFRPEQREAIDKSKKHFKKNNQFLWNAKMRFGKTLSALQLIKECEFNKSIIITHRPVVDEGWFEDFGKIFYDTDKYFYGSKNRGESFEVLKAQNKSNNKSFIYFASMQDLRGSEQVGGKFDKNCDVFSIDWDFVIIDEAHEGTKTELGLNVISALSGENTKVLRLSGTPFNLIDDFKENEIFTWDYVMEQRAKEEWDKNHWGDPNPYACLPKLNIYTYDLSLELKQKYQDGEHAFNFREFFKVLDNGEFVHDKDIDNFLNLLATSSDTMHYPYSTLEWRQNFRHSLWIVPGVKESKALSTKLQEHQTFGSFKIVNVAGNGDDEEENDDALALVKKAIGDNPDESWTITLSCGRLTTGVSVPAWTAVFMMSGSYNTSAQSYMQTIFRVQTPANYNGKQKKECFVFDFAPDRTLNVLAETAKVSAKAGHATDEDKKILEEFLNFCPVVSFHGSNMSAIDVPHMMQQLKRVYVERVVRNGFEDGYLYNNKLYQLGADELNAFDELEKIIGATPAMTKSGDIDLNNQGFTNEQYSDVDKAEKKKKKDLTEEEKRLLEEKKEKKKNRDTAVSILRGISIRMPMMLYGAEIKDDEEITIDNFTSMIDAQSWDEFMPKGVSKQKFNAFKKYYDEDIFACAGKRIREIARAADAMDIEDRIERIASIFSTFRNPDKETVLTPWRVVNMQLGDTFGGYVFFDQSMNDRLVNPRFVDHGTVTSEVYSKDSRILEINSKSGLYPLDVAYSIYRNRLDSEQKDMVVTEDAVAKRMQKKQQIWQEVLRDNIFIICKTPMAKSITKRTLSGFMGYKVNALYFDDLINQISNKKTEFIKMVSSGKYWDVNVKDMKFNAVVGNPPYQDSSINNHNGPLYHYFLDVAYSMANYATLITPGRFLFGAGDTPSDWNQKFLSDVSNQVIKYESDSSKFFPNVDIKGGVAITMRNAISKPGPIGTFCSYKELNSIIKKVKTEDFESLMTIVYTPATYKLSPIAFSEQSWLSENVGKEKRLRTNIFEKASNLFKDSKDECNDYCILGLISNKRVFKYIKSSYVEDNINKNAYKVILPKANGTGTLGETLATPVIGTPFFGHSESFISIGSFKEEISAMAVKKYICTKFVRIVLGTKKVTQDNLPESWINVPLQNFTEDSDIDWNQSVAEIDQQLYSKYKLEASEIDFIEKMVKPME